MQNLPQLIVRLLPQLDALGASRELSGLLPLTSLDKGALHFDLGAGIDYSVQLTNAGDGIVLAGTATATLASECARCLEPASTLVNGEVEGYFLLHAASADKHSTNKNNAEKEQLDAEFQTIPASGEVDLAPAIVAAIVFEAPQVPLCRQDCAGLCPRCGANRNQEPCDCPSQDFGNSPFAVLLQQ